MVGLVRKDIELELTLVDYGGEPVCLVAPRAFSDLISVRVESEELIDRFGLEQVDRQLRPARRSKAQAWVCITDQDFYLEVDGQMIVAKSNHDHSDPVAKAANAGHVILAFVDQGGESSGALIRKYAGRRRCWGAVIPVVDARSNRGTSGPRYFYLGPFDRTSVRAQGLPATFILDSNVLIDMERGHLGRLGKNQFDAIRSAAAQLVHEEVIPGVAIAELMSPVMPHDQDPSGWSRLEAALNHWLSYGSRVLVREQFTNARDVTQTSAVGPVNPLEPGHASDFINPLFAAMLKLEDLRASLPPRFNAQERLEALDEFSWWTEQSLNFSSAHLAAIAFDTFLGSRFEYLYKLMKFPAPNQRPDPAKRLRNLHGAAWDLMHLRTLDMYTSPSSSTAPFLVTADAALPDIYARLHRVGLHTSSGSNVFSLQGVEYWSKFHNQFNEGHRQRFFEMQKTYLDRALDRIQVQMQSKNLDDIRAHIWAAELEFQLEVFWERHQR